MVLSELRPAQALLLQGSKDGLRDVKAVIFPSDLFEVCVTSNHTVIEKRPGYIKPNHAPPDFQEGNVRIPPL